MGLKITQKGDALVARAKQIRDAKTEIAFAEKRGEGAVDVALPPLEDQAAFGTRIGPMQSPAWQSRPKPAIRLENCEAVVTLITVVAIGAMYFHGWFWVLVPVAVWAWMLYAECRPTIRRRSFSLGMLFDYGFMLIQFDTAWQVQDAVAVTYGELTECHSGGGGEYRLTGAICTVTVEQLQSAEVGADSTAGFEYCSGRIWSALAGCIPTPPAASLNGHRSTDRRA